MKSKLLLFTLYFLSGHLAWAQTFSEVSAIPFSPVAGTTITSVDIDGDNDLDIILTGITQNLNNVAELYINDGTGNYTINNRVPFSGVNNGSVSTADVNGDSHIDVLITGGTGVAGDGGSTKLYINDGSGEFTLSPNSFEQIALSSSVFIDVDNDNDQDLIITGGSQFDAGSTVLYLNDGAGNFSSVPNTPFEELRWSLVDVSDVDLDGDMDIFLTGIGDDPDAYAASIYLNDGTGVFTESVSNTFTGITSGDLSFFDMDADNDEDLLIIGSRVGTPNTIVQLFSNDGTGIFTEVGGTPFEAAFQSCISVADYDDDADLDVMICGVSSTSSGSISKLYTNDGTGVFTEVVGTPFQGIGLGAIAASDIDGDNDNDILIIGNNDGLQRTAHLYLNETTVSTTNNLSFSFELSLYPNPASKDLNILFKSAIHDLFEYKIYSTNGQLIAQDKIAIMVGEQNFKINTSTFAGGAYFIQISNNQNIISQPFFIQ